MRRSQVRMYGGWLLVAIGVAFIVYNVITSRQNQSFLIIDIVVGVLISALGLLRVWEARRGKAFLVIRFPFTIPAPRSASATVLRMVLIAVGGAVVTVLFYFADLAIYQSRGIALISVVVFALLTVVAMIAQPIRYNRQKRAHVG